MKMMINKKYFTMKDALDRGLTRYQLNKEIKAGKIVKIGHGLYQHSDNNYSEGYDLTKFAKAWLKSKEKGCICLWSALEYFDLTEEFIEDVWIYLPYEMNIRIQDVKVIRKRNGVSNIGTIKHEDFVITNIERTLIDILNDRKHIELKDALNICRKALREKKTTLEKIVLMAKEMNCYKRVKECMSLL